MCTILHFYKSFWCIFSGVNFIIFHITLDIFLGSSLTTNISIKWFMISKLPILITAASLSKFQQSFSTEWNKNFFANLYYIVKLTSIVLNTFWSCPAGRHMTEMQIARCRIDLWSIFTKAHSHPYQGSRNLLIHH